LEVLSAEPPKGEIRLLAGTSAINFGVLTFDQQDRLRIMMQNLFQCPNRIACGYGMFATYRKTPVCTCD
jgi:hypothetical protein